MLFRELVISGRLKRFDMLFHELFIWLTHLQQRENVEVCFTPNAHIPAIQAGAHCPLLVASSLTFPSDKSFT